jgi:hypothetical protein
MRKTLQTITAALLFLFSGLAAGTMDLYGTYDEGLPPTGRNISHMGEIMVSIGDFNNDGYDDWAAGFPDAVDQTTSRKTGKVYIYFGASGLISESAPDLILLGENSGDGFGYRLAGGEDVNGDGIPDLLIATEESKDVYIYFGSSFPGTKADVTLRSIGKYVSIAGDVNGDGYNDILIGDGSYYAYIYYGGETLSDGASWDIRLSKVSGTRYSTSLSGAGDVNNDGYDDILVGDYSADNYRGNVYLYLGAETMEDKPAAVWEGEEQGDEFGMAIAGVGDADNDGHTDFLIGAPRFDGFEGTNSGRVYLFSGASSSDDSASIIFEGKKDYQYFGKYISPGVHDINNDDITDICIGTNKPTYGKAYVFFGGSALKDSAALTLASDYSSGYFGSAAALGDLNNDGYDDILAGEYLYSINGYGRGRVSIFFGGANPDSIAGLYYSGERSEQQTGHSIASAGDVNGDGYDDMIVGSNGVAQTGKALIFFGGPGADMTADIILSDNLGNSRFGCSVASAGDVNNDGYDDVIVGAYNLNKSYIFFGGSVMDSVEDIVLTGGSGGDRFGISVSGAGDFNGDGYDDVLVGANYNNVSGTNSGRVYLYYGGASMDNVADMLMNGEVDYDYFGYSVSGAGDVNGDGFDDFIVGAHLNDEAYSSGGKAYLYLGGSSPDNAPALEIPGESAYNYFGYSVSGAGDVNGDGFDDFIIGAYGNSEAGSDAGKAYLYFGSSNPDGLSDLTFLGTFYREQFGVRVASAGDINNDGFSDLMIGNIDTYTSGKVRLFLGGTDMDNEADEIFYEETVHDGFGYALAGIGDFNADGVPDIAVGAPRNGNIGYKMGKAYVYSADPYFTLNADSVTVNKNAGNITLNISSNLGWSISCPAEWVTFSTDSAGGSAAVTVSFEASTLAQRTAEITVTSNQGLAVVRLVQSNALPRLTNHLPRIGLTEDIVDTVDISTLFSDDDDSSLTISVNVLSDTLLQAETSGDSLLILSPYFNMNGSGSLILTASDGMEQVSDTVEFYIASVNDPPVFTAPLPPLAFKEDDTLRVPLSEWRNYVYDSDNDWEWILWEINGTADIQAQIYNGVLILTASRNWFGSDTLTVTVMNSAKKGKVELSGSSPLIVTVDPINDLPVISGLADSLFITTDSVLTMEMWPLISDAEDEDSMLQVSAVCQTEDIKAVYNDEDGILSISVENNYTGDVILHIAVEDRNGGNSEDSLVIRISPVTGINGENTGIPGTFELGQNYPNPFNPGTSIRYGLPAAGKVRLTVYNVLGQKVATLVDGHKPAGYHTVMFNASRLSSGLYFYRLEVSGRSIIKKMLLVQ